MFPISRALEHARYRFADRIALVDGKTTLTYAALAGRVHRLAAALRGLGLVPGDRVAVLEANTFRHLEAYFACAHAGLVIVPINFRLAGPEVAGILGDCDARALLIGPGFLGLAEAARDAGAAPEQVVVMTDDRARAAGHPAYEDRLGAAAPMTAPAPAAPDDVTSIYYTSGTTGAPKGVCLTNATGFAGSLDGLVCLRIGPDDVWLHAAPLFHMATAMLIWPLAMAGGRQVVTGFEPGRTLELMARERVSMTAAPMILFAMLAEQPDAATRDLRALRRLVYGGAPTPRGQIDRVAEAFGPKLSHVYAMTECNGFATYLDAAEHDFGGDGPVSAGWPVPHVDLGIVGDDGARLGPGEIGEVVVSGPKIMQGYWRRPEQTAAALCDGWYSSGDLGYRDETGQVFIVDRKKDMIITGGENVYPIEVEGVLSRHPAVREVAVIGVPDDAWGEAVTAIVVPHAPGAVGADALVAHCRRALAGYKVPKRIEFRDEPLPMTGPGKIAKRLLRAPYLDRQGASPG